METPIFLYNFFTSKKEINNITRFWFVAINNLFFNKNEEIPTSLSTGGEKRVFWTDHMHSNFLVLNLKSINAYLFVNYW